MTNHYNLLKSLGVCREACNWYEGQDSKSAWHACSHGDWLLWIAAKLGVEKRLIVLAACDCAEMALHHLPSNEDRPRIAIDTARIWTQGKASIEEVQKSANAAFNAASPSIYANYANYAAYAAYAAADTVHVYNPANAASYAYIYATTAKVATVACIDRIQHHIPWSVIESAITATAAGGE